MSFQARFSLVFLILMAVGLATLPPAGASDTPTSKSSTVEPVSTIEYLNLRQILKAYRSGEPASVRSLQTAGGKKLCDLLYTKSWFFNLPAPEVTEWQDAGRPGFGPFKGNPQHNLVFVYRNSKDAPQAIKQLTLTFFLEAGSWRFHDIIATIGNGERINLSSVSSDGIDYLLKVDPNADRVADAARKVMKTPAREYDELKKAITDFQIAANSSGFATRKEVQHFTDAAVQMHAFGTRWNQTLEMAMQQNISSIIQKCFEANAEASAHVNNGIPSSNASVAAHYKNDQELKSFLEQNFKQTINALSQQDADEYAKKCKALSDAYNEVLGLVNPKSL